MSIAVPSWCATQSGTTLWLLNNREFGLSDWSFRERSRRLPRYLYGLRAKCSLRRCGDRGGHFHSCRSFLSLMIGAVYYEKSIARASMINSVSFLLKFSHRPIRTEERTLIVFVCTRCGASKLVSVKDGSLEKWEHCHECADKTTPEWIPVA